MGVLVVLITCDTLECYIDSQVCHCMFHVSYYWRDYLNRYYYTSLLSRFVGQCRKLPANQYRSCSCFFSILLQQLTLTSMFSTILVLVMDVFKQLYKPDKTDWCQGFVGCRLAGYQSSFCECTTYLFCRIMVVLPSSICLLWCLFLLSYQAIGRCR